MASRQIIVLVALLSLALPLAAQVDDSYTKSLLHFDGDIVDQSGKTWTGVGGQAATTTAKFGTAWAFDGTGKIVASTSADFEPGAVPVTIDFWCRPSSLTPAAVLGSRYLNVNTYWYFVHDTAGVLSFYNADGGSSFSVSSVATLSAGAWQHVALSRDGSAVWRLFIDGAQVASTTNVARIAPTGTDITIAGLTGSTPFNGCIDEFRFSSGVARWVASFTPPTSPYAPAAETGSSGPVLFSDGGRITFAEIPGNIYGTDDSYTAALLHFDHDASGEPGTVIDEVGGTWTNGGTGANAGRVATDPTKFGTKAYATQPEVSWLIRSAYAGIDITTGDWTMEWWVRPADTTAGTGQYLYYAAVLRNVFYANPGLYFYNGTDIIGKAGTSLATGTWTHVAVTRESNTVSIWVGGEMIESKTVTGSLATAGVDVYLSYNAGSEDAMLDEIRISKGIARYTATFTPPLLPFYGATAPNLQLR